MELHVLKAEYIVVYVLGQEVMDWTLGCSIYVMFSYLLSWKNVFY